MRKQTKRSVIIEVFASRFRVQLLSADSVHFVDTRAEHEAPIGRVVRVRQVPLPTCVQYILERTKEKVNGAALINAIIAKLIALTNSY